MPLDMPPERNGERAGPGCGLCSDFILWGMPFTPENLRLVHEHIKFAHADVVREKYADDPRFK